MVSLRFMERVEMLCNFATTVLWVRLLCGTAPASALNSDFLLEQPLCYRRTRQVLDPPSLRCAPIP